MSKLANEFISSVPTANKELAKVAIDLCGARGITPYGPMCMTATSNKAVFALGQNASTLHKACVLPVSQHCKGWSQDLPVRSPADQGRLRDLQLAWANVYIYAIDECSQMGIETHDLMQRRTQQLLAGTNRALCQICVGDYGQLGVLNWLHHSALTNYPNLRRSQRPRSGCKVVSNLRTRERRRFHQMLV